MGTEGDDMKTYKRHRLASEVLELAKARGIAVDTLKFDRGGDHLVLHMDGPDDWTVPVMYNVVSGRFFYAGEGYPHFGSDPAFSRDGEPWFDALLDFFYTDEELPE